MKKTLTVITLCFALISCSKEYSFESGSTDRKSTTLSWSYSVNAGTMTLNVNGANTVLAFPETRPGAFVAIDGQSVNGGVTTGLPYTILITRTLRTAPFTTETVFAISSSGSTPIPSFIINADYTYIVQVS